jgi:1-deoxy-D-xylulose-5-phosphate synthase
MSRILDGIDSPLELKQLTIREMEQLATELRQEIVQTVSHTGGHLAPSLGTVELTLALYAVFDFPTDKLVWDVGHQAYAHKLLTGRRDRFRTLRQQGGISGFPKRTESRYDAFGVGHASTSVSAALGMALARDMDHQQHQVVAVLGDGALTGGESFEALNHAGDLGTHLIVILNDNDMSIDKNVGAMSAYLSRIRVLPQYHQAKKDLEGLLRGIPHIGDKVVKTAKAIKDDVRSALVPGRLFEEMGFTYVGPLDGHDISLMMEMLREVRQMAGPVLVHIHTKKGKGYLPAEEHPEVFHGVGRFDAATGELQKREAPPSYTSVFSRTLIELAASNTDIAAITAAMPTGTGLKEFGKAYPDRFFDVGIAEEHAMTLAAGMAAAGKHPVIALYSTFAQRAYDQILHDICLQDLPVTLCLDRAGLVGADGPTHHGVFDLSYLRHIPNMSIMAPKDENELRHMLSTAIKCKAPVALRYPRGAGLGVEIEPECHDIPFGKAEILSKGGNIAFLAIGSMVDNASKAAIALAGDGIDSTVVNMRFVKPLDADLLRRLAGSMKLLITLEENVLAGGFGSAVGEFLLDEGLQVPLLRFGLPDRFVGQGTRDELWEALGLLPEQIAERVKDRLQHLTGEE